MPADLDIFSPFTVSYTEVPVSFLFVSGPYSVKPGETIQLTANVYPLNATDKTVMWSSSDAAVATVDQNGVVTGVSTGSATITATSVNGKKYPLTIAVQYSLENAELTAALNDGVAKISIPKVTFVTEPGEDPLSGLQLTVTKGATTIYGEDVTRK